MTAGQDRRSDCLELDLDIVWDTVQTAIPDLETNLRSITTPSPPQPSP